MCRSIYQINSGCKWN